MRRTYLAVLFAVVGLVTCPISPSLAVTAPADPPITLMLRVHSIVLEPHDLMVLDSGEIVIAPGRTTGFQPVEGFDSNVTTRQCTNGGGVVVKKCKLLCLILYEVCQGGDHNGEKIIDVN